MTLVKDSPRHHYIHKFAFLPFKVVILVIIILLLSFTYHAYI